MEEIHFIGQSKTSSDSMTKTYRVVTPNKPFGDPDHWDTFRVESLFTDLTARVTTSGQPAPKVGAADERYNNLICSDLSISQSATEDQGHWIFEVSVSYVNSSQYQQVNNSRLLPWDIDPKWSSTRGQAENYKSFDADGKPLIYSDFLPFVAPVSTDSVIVYTVNYATLTAPYPNQYDFLNKVNSTAFTLPSIGLNCAAGHLWVNAYQVTEDDYQQPNGTPIRYYNVSISLSHNQDDKWSTKVIDQVQRKHEEVSNDGTVITQNKGWALLSRKDKSGNEMDFVGAVPGNGSGSPLKSQGVDDGRPIVFPAPTSHYPANWPLMDIAAGGSILDTAAVLEFWFRKRADFATLELG